MREGMAEAFLVLLAAGVMLSAAVPAPAEVTLRWLRLAGIIALVMAGLSLFLWLQRGELRPADQGALYCAVLFLILAQLAMVQTGRGRVQRVFAVIAAVAGVVLAMRLCGRWSMAIGLS